MNVILTILLGLAGGWLGGLIGRATGMYKERRSAGFFMSLVGALILLIIYDLIS